MTFRNRLTAWLGLIAMWMIVFAPMVSHLAVAAQANEPAGMLCSASQPALEHEHHTPADKLGACGYCNLLEHHVVMPVIPPAPIAIALVTATTAVPALSTRFTPLVGFPSGRPRGPPSVS